MCLGPLPRSCRESRGGAWFGRASQQHAGALGAAAKGEEGREPRCSSAAAASARRVLLVSKSSLFIRKREKRRASKQKGMNFILR